MLSAYLGRLLTLDAAISFVFWFGMFWLARKAITRTLKTTTLRALIFGVCISVVLAFTIRIYSVYTFGPGYWLFSSMWGNALRLTDANWYLNAGLFVPAGFALMMAGRGLWKSLLTLTLVSVSIESLQFWARSGVSDPADLVANVCGALVGIGLCAAALSLGWIKPSSAQIQE